MARSPRSERWVSTPGLAERGGECRGFIDILDSLGFHSDAAVSLPYNFRHMTNCNLVVPEEVDARLFERCRHLLPDVAGHPPLGLNAKFRCYRYAAGDYFRPHTDGAWPGSRFRDGQYLADAYGDRMSRSRFSSCSVTAMREEVQVFIQAQVSTATPPTTTKTTTTTTTAL
ncbi:unnamed protein product [Polarella glacialis]|uniref:Prolyl 4-hydroxylase alpha subunit Fe(2+) 2OG dioxygenase domain-containing protein n=1 Tax=Polarella glacialis TaxID=89957 RepID=A0A813ELK3_POLGL|nr:unnamed protein product [Polarella glacialis]